MAEHLGVSGILSAVAAAGRSWSTCCGRLRAPAQPQQLMLEFAFTRVVFCSMPARRSRWPSTAPVWRSSLLAVTWRSPVLMLIRYGSGRSTKLSLRIDQAGGKPARLSEDLPASALRCIEAGVRQKYSEPGGRLPVPT